MKQLVHIYLRGPNNFVLSAEEVFEHRKIHGTNCVIYRLYNELYSKMKIDIYTYRKYVVLALT